MMQRFNDEYIPIDRQILNEISMLKQIPGTRHMKILTIRKIDINLIKQ